MAHYLIYVPSVQGANDKHLLDRGLGDLCRDRGPDWIDVTRGPDGGRGMLCTWRTMEPDVDPAFEINLDRQVWVKGPGNEEAGIVHGSYWIGHETDRPPTPLNLARPTQHPGRMVMLKDGFPWLIPEAMQLPHLVGLDPETGAVTLRHTREFEAFCRQSEDFAYVMCQQIGLLEQLQKARPNTPAREISIDFPLKDAWSFATTALSLNYRVCPAIVDYLGLFTRHEIVAVVAATISLPDILEVRDDQKKTEEVSIPVG